MKGEKGRGCGSGEDVWKKRERVWWRGIGLVGEEWWWRERVW